MLIPTRHAAALASVAADRMPDDIIADLVAGGVPARTLDLGDPGATHDALTPRAQLPEYTGPTEPAAPHSHEWGAALADAAEDSPFEGPALRAVRPGSRRGSRPGRLSQSQWAPEVRLGTQVRSSTPHHHSQRATRDCVHRPGSPFPRQHPPRACIHP